MSTWMTFSRTGAAVAALAALVVAPVLAQQPPPTQPRPAAKQATPQATPAPPNETPRADSALRQRVEQLEEQLVDMQQAVGTLESFARSGGAAGGQRLPAAAAASGDSGRLDALESQVRNLAQQVEQLTRELRAQGGRPAGPVASIQTPPPPAAGGAFATTVTPERDPISQIIGGGTAPPAAAPTFNPAAPSDATAKQLYETAYGFLLQQDYGAAEAGFEDFLRRFPSDALAGNAQYWLGETHYVRGQYKQAAGAFLKGYQTYGRSSKAPDSLLKLAMSLDRLGQRDAACSSYGELAVKFPNAPNAVRSRAEQERRRLACA